MNCFVAAGDDWGQRIKGSRSSWISSDSLFTPQLLLRTFFPIAPRSHVNPLFVPDTWPGKAPLLSSGVNFATELLAAVPAACRAVGRHGTGWKHTPCAEIVSLTMTN